MAEHQRDPRLSRRAILRNAWSMRPMLDRQVATCGSCFVTKACRAAGVEDRRPNDQRAQSLTQAEEPGHNPTDLAGHAGQALPAAAQGEAS
jgi:hypothetical protein